MDASLPGVEFEAPGRIASTVGKDERETLEKAGKSATPGLFIPHCEIFEFSPP